MKFFIIFLILAALIQSSFLSINLCLVILICRSLIVDEPLNYWAGFFIGIFLGLLQGQNIGFWPLIFLLMIKIASVLKSLPFSSNIFTVLPISLVLLSLTTGIENIFLHQMIDFKKVIIETLISFPIYLIFRFWEERFVVKNDIKLKIRN
jgi:hypothetical protein